MTKEECESAWAAFDMRAWQWERQRVAIAAFWEWVRGPSWLFKLPFVPTCRVDHAANPHARDPNPRHPSAASAA